MADLHALSAKMKEIFPENPQADRQALLSMAGNPAQESLPQQDVHDNIEPITEGTLPLDIDNIADFAALAGVTLNEKQKMGSAGQAKGSDSMPAMSKPSTTGEQPHPLKDKLVGEDEDLDRTTELAELKGILDYAVRELADTVEGIDDAYIQRRLKILLQELEKATGNVNESGILYKAGVNKYTKAGMKKIQSAAGKGASAEEIGKIKDQYNKKKKQKNESIKEQLLKALEDIK